MSDIHGRPLPTQKEIIFSEKEPIFSRTNEQGEITYSNAYFQKISGYSEEELLGANHNIVRHPDMPKAIFFFMWQRLKKGKGLKAVVKNLAKNGDYYWVITKFSIGEVDGKIIYSAKRTPAPRKLVEHFEPIYAKMVELEELAMDDNEGMKHSLEYFTELLNKAGKDYDTYVDDIVSKFSIGGLFKKMFF